jgi:hypothetical protein
MSEAQVKAGYRNLLEWKRTHPSGGKLAHGAYSVHVRKRYSDARTIEGKRLKAIIAGLTEDLGGQEQITSAQRIVLDAIRSKIQVVLQIGKYVDRQPSIISDSGEVLPCLGRHYLAFSESINRDLERLYNMANRRPSKVLDLETYLQSKE